MPATVESAPGVPKLMKTTVSPGAPAAHPVEGFLPPDASAHTRIFSDCCPRSNPVGFYLELELALETARHQLFEQQPDFDVILPEEGNTVSDGPGSLACAWTGSDEAENSLAAILRTPPFWMTLSILVTFYAISAYLALLDIPGPASATWTELVARTGWLPLLLAGGTGLLGQHLAASYRDRARQQLEELFQVDILPGDHWLAKRTASFARAAGIPVPAVGLMPHANAFAVGSGDGVPAIVIGLPLIRGLEPEELDAVIGHELAHLASGDMKQMLTTLGYQSQLASLPEWLFSRTKGRRAGEPASVEPDGRVATLIRHTLLFGGELILQKISRRREFLADAAGAELTSQDAMIAALRKLHAIAETTPEESRFSCLMIRGASFGHFLATHPALEQRIQALESGRHASIPAKTAFAHDPSPAQAAPTSRRSAENDASRPSGAAMLAVWMLAMLGAGVTGFFAFLTFSELMPAW